MRRIGAMGAGVVSILISMPAMAGGGLASLSPSSSGVTTFEAQTRLRELGYEPGKLDGYYGKRTAAALKAFQKMEELPATGALDARTLARLQQMKNWFGADDVAALPQSIQRESEGADERQYVIELYNTAQVDDEKLRIMAVDLLASMQTSRSFAALRLVLITNSLPSVRAAAAKKIAANGDQESLESLAFSLDFEKDATVRGVIHHAIDATMPTHAGRHVVAVTAEMPLPLDD